MCVCVCRKCKQISFKITRWSQLLYTGILILAAAAAAVASLVFLILFHFIYFFFIILLAFWLFYFFDFLSNLYFSIIQLFQAFIQSNTETQTRKELFRSQRVPASSSISHPFNWISYIIYILLLHTHTHIPCIKTFQFDCKSVKELFIIPTRQVDKLILMTIIVYKHWSDSHCGSHDI